MYLYNETVGIDASVEQDWLTWVKAVYIPEVLKTQLFINYNLYKVLHENNDGGVSYSIQFFSTTLDQVIQYVEVFAPALIEQQRLKFNNQHVVFRTLLEEVK